MGLADALTKASVAPVMMAASKALLLRNHKATFTQGKALIDVEESVDFVNARAFALRGG